MSLTLGLTLASTGWGIGSSIYDRSRQKKAKEKRGKFFDNEINSILGKMTNNLDDVDFDSIRSAEMRMPTLQFQDQMRDISTQRDSRLGQSGFADSGFINQDFDAQRTMATEGLASQRFNVDRGIIDMQSQLESMINENKLRAKELEFSYKYG